MKSLVAALVLASVAVPAFAAETAVQPALAAPVAVKGKLLVASGGARLAPVYRVANDGSAQIILDGRMVTIPASTLAVVDGKLTTNLTKSEVIAIR
ncbi:MAG: hypothetical protein ABW173_06650 [Sphingomonas sp.]